MTPWQIIEGLAETTFRILPVAGACAAAGLVIGGLSMTGLGMKAANLILTVTSGVDVYTLVIAAIVTIILGLGMPTPSAYILAAVLVGPALAKIGFPVFESHMFLIYFAILSALTPPIAVAALAAAAIAEEDPIILAVDAVRLAVVGFLMPFVFLWNPALLGKADLIAVALAIIGGTVAVAAISVSVEWVRVPGGKFMLWPFRLALLACAVAAVAPETVVATIGIGCGAAILVSIYLNSRRGSRDKSRVAAE